MYPVSEAFLTVVQENTRSLYWTGRITTKAGVVYEFGNGKIVKGSGYITSRCCGSTEIEIGTVYTDNDIETYRDVLFYVGQVLGRFFCMNLGVNPLLQFGLEETRKALLTNSLNDLSVILYVPFDSDTIGSPALDLGDVLVFFGGHADERQMACVTGYQIKVNGKHFLKCVGKNPASPLSAGRAWRRLRPGMGR